MSSVSLEGVSLVGPTRVREPFDDLEPCIASETLGDTTWMLGCYTSASEL